MYDRYIKLSEQLTDISLSLAEISKSVDELLMDNACGDSKEEEKIVTTKTLYEAADEVFRDKICTSYRFEDGKPITTDMFEFSLFVVNASIDDVERICDKIHEWKESVQNFKYLGYIYKEVDSPVDF